MIFCLSQLHTGTQTSLAWLCKHDEVDGMMLSTGVHKLFGLVDPADTVHDWESGRIHERFSEGMVYHEHVRCDRQNPYRMNRTQLVMATIFPTLIPIRDPLASIISYQHRADFHGVPGQWAPDLDLFNRWVAMAEIYPYLDSRAVQFLPWDLWENDHPGLNKIERHLGLRERSDIPTILNNCSGPYELRRCYLEGDVDALKSRLKGNLWRDLVEREGQLRPMLESLGYHELLWWDR